MYVQQIDWLLTQYTVQRIDPSWDPRAKPIQQWLDMLNLEPVCNKCIIKFIK